MLGIDMEDSHIPDSQMERYVTCMIHDDAELHWVEDHLFHCPACTERMWASQEHVDNPDSGTGETDEPDLYRQNHPLQ